MLTDFDKLNQIRAILDTPAAPAALQAYDRPSITEDQAVVDGKTVNVDGSVWGKSDGFSPIGPANGAPLCISFGYISPVKTPEIWEHAKKVLAPDYFAVWDAAWKKNPYGLYRADVRALLRQGTEVNTMLFSALLDQPYGTFVQ